MYPQSAPSAFASHPIMYLETIIDQPPYLQIIYHYAEDHGATLLQTTWSTLDQFCEPHRPYELKLEHFDAPQNNLTQTYHPTDLKTWLAQLPQQYKTTLIEQFVAYCQKCQTTQSVTFYR